jgi:hypothetical protein
LLPKPVRESTSRMTGSARSGWKCIPIVATTYGEWGDEATEFLDKLSTRIAMQTTCGKGEVKSAVFKRLSLVLMRSNVQAILSKGGYSAVGREEIVTSGNPDD